MNNLFMTIGYVFEEGASNSLDIELETVSNVEINLKLEWYNYWHASGPKKTLNEINP